MTNKNKNYVREMSPKYVPVDCLVGELSQSSLGNHNNSLPSAVKNHKSVCGPKSVDISIKEPSFEQEASVYVEQKLCKGFDDAKNLFSVFQCREETLSEPISDVKKSESNTPGIDEENVEMEVDQNDIQDLCRLDHLTQDVIIDCLRKRFENEKFYTYIGDVLVAVNPCKQLPIYGSKKHEEYKNLRSRHEKPPHIYWTADHAFRSLVESRMPRCIVVSGVSGAGKTESTKYILKHILQQGKCSVPNLVDKLRKVNPLLELFGNAATTLNQNSSRFGKFVELHYQDDGHLTGACIQCYMLEKSRVVCHNKKEKNFHVFYSILAGLSSDDLILLHLDETLGDFRILTGSSFYNDSLFRDADERQEYRLKYDEAVETLHSVGFTETDIEDLHKVLAAILLISNIAFIEDEEAGLIIKDNHMSIYLKPALELLGLQNGEEFVRALQTNIRYTEKGEEIASSKTLFKAIEDRDALVKHIYSSVFSLIVKQINKTLGQFSSERSGTSTTAIGILDISGLENLETSKNSFEQLLINITNETLHQFFLEHMFQIEREEYYKEGVAYTAIHYTDNRETLDILIKEHVGIIPSLEETMKIHKTENDFIGRLNDQLSESPRYKKKSSKRPLFGVVHFAGEIVYDATGFIGKNSDTCTFSLKRSIKSSQNLFLDRYRGDKFETLSRMTARRAISNDAPPPSENKHGRSRLQEFVSTDFKSSLKRLDGKLHGMKPLFVRCIKPNKTLSPRNFDRAYVETQLLYSGLLDVAVVRKEGYPARFGFDEFIQRFLELVEDVSPNLPNKEKIESILQRANIDDYQIGVRKVFMKDYHVEILDARIDRKIRIREERQRRKEEAARLNDLKEKERLCTTSSTHSETSSAYSSGSSVTSSPPTVRRKNFPDNVHIQFKDSEDQTNDDYSQKDVSTDNEAIFPTGMAYDMFRQTEREQENSNLCETRVLQACRMIIYALLFVLVLASGVWAKMCLFTLMDKYNEETGSKKNEYANKLMVILLFGPTVTFVFSLFKLLFGHTEALNKGALLALIVSEICSACGYSLLMFKVLPQIDIFRRCVVMMNVILIPTFLNFIDNIKQPDEEKVFKVAKLVTAAMAFLVQGGVSFGIYFLGFFENGETVLGNRGFETWILPVSLFLISITWWENFIHRNVGIVPIDICGFLKQMRKARTYSSAVLMLIRIVTVVVCTRTFVEGYEFVLTFSTDPQVSSPRYGNLTMNDSILSNFTLNSENNTSQKDVNDMDTDTSDAFNVSRMQENMTEQYNATELSHYSSNEAIADFWNQHFWTINVAVASMMCSYAATLACKLYMQRLAFALPLVLISPLTIAIIVLECNNILPFDGLLLISSTHPCAMDLGSLTIPMTSAALLFINIMLLTYYLWCPKTERMAKLERMFIEPARDAVFVDINLLLRRKNDMYVDTEDTEDACNSTNKVPMVYVCATMWHETETEMKQLLKSLFRLDFHCATARLAETKFKVEDPDKFQTEIHIIFDDAFELDEKTKQFVPNMFVKRMIGCVGDAARSVLHAEMDWGLTPSKKTTAYGGELKWTLPGGTAMVIHLKDKNKVRHRKRWSQILYMYYLLGYKSFGSKKASTVLEPLQKKTFQNRPRRGMSLLNNLKPEDIEKAENTFILALDGDVDFQPKSVLMLIDRMKKNKMVGAVCGRIHPIGAGPMVWYQQFEYAVGHWLQKASEHVFGCVLCCPGCFSLFRASALMDDNVMATYTKQPTEAKHYLQFEQGEDRWLCTLLLQQGYKIDYCAGADAYTYAPETFKEFFQQRRRWAPSTMANLMDLLSSWDTTVKLNPNISTAYMFYQFILLISGLLAPGTVTLMIAGSYSTVLGINMWYSFLLAIAPVIVLIVICFECDTENQLKAAGLLSSIYTIVMVIVTVGTVLNIANDDILSPNAIFIAGLAVIFIVSGIWHPKEIGCMVHCILYFVTVPSTFVFLTVYYLCNLHNVSWGTREVVTKPEKSHSTTEPKEERKKSKGWIRRIFGSIKLSALLKDIQAVINQISNKERNAECMDNLIPEEIIVENSKKETNRMSFRKYKGDCREPLDPDHWMSVQFLDKSPVTYCSEADKLFWKDLINKYIYPLKEDKEHERIKKDLIGLRNNVVFGFFQLNLMFSIALLQMQINEDNLKGIYIAGKYEPVSVAFLCVFASILFVQFLGMLLHRWSTFQHLVASTKIELFSSHFDKDSLFNEALKETQKLTTIDPEPDYFDETEIPADYESGSELEPDYSDAEMDDRKATPVKNVYDRMFRPNFYNVRQTYVHHLKSHERRFSNRRLDGDIRDYRGNRGSGSRSMLYYRTLSRKHGKHLALNRHYV